MRGILRYLSIIGDRGDRSRIMEYEDYICRNDKKGKEKNWPYLAGHYHALLAEIVNTIGREKLINLFSELYDIRGEK